MKKAPKGRYLILHRTRFAEDCHIPCMLQSHVLQEKEASSCQRSQAAKTAQRLHDQPHLRMTSKLHNCPQCFKMLLPFPLPPPSRY